MKKVVFLLITSLAIGFTACNKDKINKVNPSDIEVSLDKAALQQRIEMINQPVTFNSFKAGPTTPIPELWAIARLLPANRTYKIYHWIYTDNRPTVPVVYHKKTATSATPSMTLPPIYDPLHPEYASNTATVNFSAWDAWDGVAGGDAFENFNETLSMTGAGLNSTLDHVYFTSHVRGDVYGGEIFAVRYTDNDGTDDFNALQAEYSIFDNTADYNDLTIDGSTLWVVGDNDARGAIVRKTDLTALNLLLPAGAGPVTDPGASDAFQYGVTGLLTDYHMPILGPSGNSISVFGNQLWVVAGGTSYGGLVVMDKTDATRLYTRVDRKNAKHFDMGEFNNSSIPAGYYGAFLWGDGIFANNNANLRIFNTSGGPFDYKDFTIPADVTFEGKNAIDVSSDGAVEAASANQSIYLAMGADGVVKIDADAAYTGGVPALTIDGVINRQLTNIDTYGGNGLANGLVVHGAYVYVAWGASGLVILDKSDLSFVGQYNGIGSCNYVAFDDNPAGEDLLFAGFGTGGIVMFKFVNDL